MIFISSILITMHQKAALIDDGAIVVGNGMILAAGPSAKIVRQFPRHPVRRLQNTVLLPGLINVHAHLELPPLLDSIRAASLPDWALNLIKAKKELDLCDYTLATKQNIESLIRTGTTTVAEICTHEVSPAILKQSGLRATIFHEVISMNPAAPFPRLSSLVSRPSARIRLGLSPHAPHTVSEMVLQEIKKIASKKSIPLCMHVAESKDEVRLLQRKRSGFERLYQAAGWDPAWAPTADSPFEYLVKLGLLGPKFLAVHAVQATDRDIRFLSKSRTSIAHCPRSNKELGIGRLPLKKFLDAGITVGLGTDSLASSPSLNMWDEMRCVLQIHRRDGITAEDVLRLATIEGAKALGMETEVGALEAGKKADIIAVPLPGRETGDFYSDLIRETKSCIMTVVDGKILYDKQCF